ncbi:TetR family transcriptional regulator [Nocardiopsis coralliicola]
MAVQAPVGVRSRSQNQRRKRIVQTAAALALRGGVEAMQMRTVAERAGVALGTLYRYFPSKMDLVVAVVTEELDLLEASISRRPPAADTIAARLVDVLQRATRALLREPELADALVRSLIMAEITTEIGRRITDLLWRVAEGAESDPDAQPDRASEPYLLVGALASAWVFELLAVLRSERDVDDVPTRLSAVARRLFPG